MPYDKHAAKLAAGLLSCSGEALTIILKNLEALEQINGSIHIKHLLNRTLDNRCYHSTQEINYEALLYTVMDEIMVSLLRELEKLLLKHKKESPETTQMTAEDIITWIDEVIGDTEIDIDFTGGYFDFPIRAETVNDAYMALIEDEKDWKDKLKESAEYIYSTIFPEEDEDY